MKYTQESLVKYLSKKKKELLRYGMVANKYYGTKYDWVNNSYFNWSLKTGYEPNPRIGYKPKEEATSVLCRDLKTVTDFIITNTKNAIYTYDTTTCTWWTKNVKHGGGSRALLEIMGKDAYDKIAAQMKEAETLEKSISTCIEDAECFDWYKAKQTRYEQKVDVDKAKKCFDLLEEVIKTYIAINQ